MKLDKKSTVSLYIQLMHVIKEQIHNITCSIIIRTCSIDNANHVFVM